jgi:DNA excision repair protein ERCC-2
MRQDRDNSEKIVEYIRAFSAIPGNLAVYFPSYHILDQYASRISRISSGKKVFIEPKDAKEAGSALNEFVGLPAMQKSGILCAVCGGKWSEGLDYRGDMLRGAMVIGLPLAPFNRPRRMIIDYFRHKFGEEGEFICYTLPAINRAQQALGRVLRTPEDRGVLVFGEKRFLEGKVRAGLPGWIRDEMTECDIIQFRSAVSGWK